MFITREDADTTGAVYGQLAGAVYGKEAIPGKWANNLSMQELIEAYAIRLYESSQ